MGSTRDHLEALTKNRRSRNRDKKEVSGNMAMINVLVTNRKIAGKQSNRLVFIAVTKQALHAFSGAGMEILPTFQTTLNWEIRFEL